MTWFVNLRKKKTAPSRVVPEVNTDAAQSQLGPQSQLAPAATREIDIPPTDPLLAYLLENSGVIEVDQLQMDSPTLQAMKAARVHLAVPLISQGELIGLLNLGPRLSETEYSSDDRRLLSTLSTQASPALRVAQMARQRAKMEHELRVARVIQQTLLPKEIPALPGWGMAAYWQPASAVSGDFYDFVTFPDGKLAIIAGDVTDKGVPAALVMATTRSIMRVAAEALAAPGLVLEEANNRLCPDIPPNMFVTCLYALLDPATGILRYANAGHNPPFQRSESGVAEMRARGMPLGLMPDMVYEEKEVAVGPGDRIVFYSDGLTEAHNPEGEMFGFPRLRQLMAMPQCGEAMIHCLVDELKDFTGPEWEQEDDVTFVTLDRLPAAGVLEPQCLAKFSLPSHPGNERQAMQRVAKAVQSLNLPQKRLERLKTAVAEATMNAMEHGNNYRSELPVEVEVFASPERLSVAIRDHGGGQEYLASEEPHLESKLAGSQTQRGWGLFLIKNMVDEMQVSSGPNHHTIELFFNL